MIPQAIASKDPAGDLWSHVKSMLHAIKRVESSQLSPLDRSRLEHLAEFIKKEIAADKPGHDMTAEALMRVKTDHYTYTLDVDLPKQLHALESYQNWKKSKPTKDKDVLLVNALTDWLNATTDGLKIIVCPPKIEFNILRELLGALLNQTEAALLA